MRVATITTSEVLRRMADGAMDEDTRLRVALTEAEKALAVHSESLQSASLMRGKMLTLKSVEVDAQIAVLPSVRDAVLTAVEADLTAGMPAAVQRVDTARRALAAYWTKDPA